MKCAVTDKTNITKIPRDITEIHLVRPIKKEKLEELFSSRQIKSITASDSCIKRLTPRARQRIKEAGVELQIERRRGRALNVSLEKMLEIIELRKDFQSIREIEKVTGVPKSTIHYLLKYADRGKIKKGSTVIYLK